MRPAKTSVYSNHYCDFCKFSGHRTTDCRKKVKAEKEKVGSRRSEKGRKPKRESAAVASNSLSWVADSNDESSSDDEPVRAKVTRVSGGGREREHVFIAAHLTKESHDNVNINSGASRHLCLNLSWFKPSTFRALKNPIPISTANASTILATATAVDAVTLVNCHPAMAALGQCTYSSSYWG